MFRTILGTPVTLKTLLDRLKLWQNYTGGQTSLYKLLKRIGFSYQRENNRRALMETPHIAYQRRRFLEKYMENELKGDAKEQYVFLDETWIFSNGSFRRSWQDDDVRSVRKVKAEGNRYVTFPSY